MSAKVGIGIKTCEDVSSIVFDPALYDLLVSSAPKLAPYRIEVLYDKFEVENAQDFASHWCTENRHVLHQNVIEKTSEFRILDETELEAGSG